MRPAPLKPTEERMRMAVSEGRHQKSAGQIDDLGVDLDGRPSGGLTESGDATVIDKKCGFVRLPWSHPDGTADEKLWPTAIRCAAAGIELSVASGIDHSSIPSVLLCRVSVASHRG